VPGTPIIFPEVLLSSLYKYRPLTHIEHIPRMLSLGELWFGSARSFNDPFDTSITYNFDGVDTPLAERWAADAAHRHMPDATEKENRDYVARRLREIRNNPRELEVQQAKQIEMAYNRFGICPLTAAKDSLLMWAHYADSHKGICVGLDLTVLRRATIALLKTNDVLECLPVIYSGDMPQVNFFEAMLDHDNPNHAMIFVRVKSDHWQYEQEYRLIIHDRIDIALPIGPELIKEVICGCKMPEIELHHLADYCRVNLPNARLFKTEKDTRLFRLNILPNE
jgi:hypothetical protein